jgi:XTP/dITP diphosphohydrolase
MKKIVIASSNKYKISEISINIQPFFDTILSFSDFPKIGEIIEDGTTIEENSFIKSRASFKYTGLASVADDTILEVDHLNGEPGLFTARYAGKQATYNQNMDKLLKKLYDVENNMRTARFRTVISYVDGVNDFHVDGALEGKILKNKIGNKGFGYDPIFYVEKYDKSLAQINSSLKNDISHRGVAIKKFVSMIKELNQ